MKCNFSFLKRGLFDEAMHAPIWMPINLWLDECAEQLHAFTHQCVCAALHAAMRAGRHTCANRSAIKATDVCIQSGLPFICESYSAKLPFSLLSFTCDVIIFDPLPFLCQWDLSSRFLTLLVASQSPPSQTSQPQLASPWPLTPDPLALLLYSCVPRISIRVDWLLSVGMSVGSICPWNPLGSWFERRSIGELAWAANRGEKRGWLERKLIRWQEGNNRQDIFQTRTREWKSQSNEGRVIRKEGTVTLENRDLIRRQNTEWTVRGQSDVDVRQYG